MWSSVSLLWPNEDVSTGKGPCRCQIVGSLKHWIVEVMDYRSRVGIGECKYYGVQFCCNSPVKMLAPARELMDHGLLEWKLDD